MPEPSASRSQDALHPNVLHPLMVGEHVETDVHLVRVAGVVATPARYLTNGHNSVGTALPAAGHHFRSLSRPEQNGCFSGLGWPKRDDALQPWPKDPGSAKGVGHEASGVATQHLDQDAAPNVRPLMAGALLGNLELLSSRGCGRRLGGDGSTGG